MSKLFYTASSTLLHWDIVGNAITNQQSVALTGGAARVGVSDSWVVCPQTSSSNTLQIFPRTDGGANLGSEILSSISGASAEGVDGVKFSPVDENLLIAVHQRNVYVIRLDEAGAITILDSVAKDFVGPNDVSWNHDGTRFVYSGGNSNGFVYASWDGASITKLATYLVGENAEARFCREGTRVVAVTEDTGGDAYIYEVSESALSLLDSTAHPSASSSWEDLAVNPAGTLAVAGARSASGTPKLWDISADTFVQVAEFPHEIFQCEFLDDGTVVTVRPSSSTGTTIDTVETWSVSDSALTKAGGFRTSTTQDAELMRDAIVTGPTTNEELFQASYADASAADPKVTALIRPADVQRSIDTDVSNLKDGPNLYTVEVVFDIGELESLNPYNATTEKPRVFFVKDDQPGLRAGKNLLLKSYTIRDANPAVPVTCTFWG